MYKLVSINSRKFLLFFQKMPLTCSFNYIFRVKYILPWCTLIYLFKTSLIPRVLNFTICCVGSSAEIFFFTSVKHLAWERKLISLIFVAHKKYIPVCVFLCIFFTVLLIMCIYSKCTCMLLL